MVKGWVMKFTKNGTSMNIAVSINSSGQATIPKVVRDYLRVVPGQNRLVFEMVDGRVVLGREPSRAEMLDASINRIRKNLKEERKNNPDFAYNYEKYRGLSYREFMDAYQDTEADKSELKEKYGI